MKLIQIYKADLLNGTGLRNVYFFSGCTHHCKGCFNSETADPDMPLAKKWTERNFEQLIEDTKPDYISGITLSGGDPLSPWNESGILDLCKRFKELLPGKTVWCYTGFTWEAIMNLPEDSPKKQALQYIDVLCEGPFIEERKSPTKPWVGSDNQRVIDVKKSLQENKIVLYN